MAQILYFYVRFHVFQYIVAPILFLFFFLPEYKRRVVQALDMRLRNIAAIIPPCSQKQKKKQHTKGHVPFSLQINCDCM